MPKESNGCGTNKELFVTSVWNLCKGPTRLHRSSREKINLRLNKNFGLTVWMDNLHKMPQCVKRRNRYTDPNLWIFLSALSLSFLQLLNIKCCCRFLSQAQLTVSAIGCSIQCRARCDSLARASIMMDQKRKRYEITKTPSF